MDAVPSTLTIRAKSINIGSLKGIPVDPIVFSVLGLDMYIECKYS